METSQNFSILLLSAGCACVSIKMQSDCGQKESAVFLQLCHRCLRHLVWDSSATVGMTTYVHELTGWRYLVTVLSNGQADSGFAKCRIQNAELSPAAGEKRDFSMRPTALVEMTIKALWYLPRGFRVVES